MAHQRQRDISYTLSEDVQTTFPDIVELESDTVKSGLDVAMYYAIAGMFAKTLHAIFHLQQARLQLICSLLWMAGIRFLRRHMSMITNPCLTSFPPPTASSNTTAQMGLKGAAEHRVKTVRRQDSVKGTDYWTSADKAEIVNDTLAAMPKWTGGSY